MVCICIFKVAAPANLFRRRKLIWYFRQMFWDRDPRLLINFGISMRCTWPEYFEVFITFANKPNLPVIPWTDSVFGFVLWYFNTTSFKLDLPNLAIILLIILSKQYYTEITEEIELSIQSYFIKILELAHWNLSQ